MNDGKPTTAALQARRPLAVTQVMATAAGHLDAGRAAEAAMLYREVLVVQPGHAAALAGLEAAGARIVARGAGSPAHRGLDVVAARRSPSRRFAARVVRPVLEGLAQRPRVLKYRMLSTCSRVTGSPVRLQPVLFLGSGAVVLGDDVQFGWKQSPAFYTGYCHVEVARPDAVIEIGSRTEFNNNAMLKSEGPGIRVGADGLFGAHVEVFDSDFHDLDPRRRRSGVPRMAPVEIGANVFVGMGVRILKGVTIGDDAVIGAGSLVTSSIPAGVIAAGNPARVVREL